MMYCKLATENESTLARQILEYQDGTSMKMPDTATSLQVIIQTPIWMSAFQAEWTASWPYLY